MYQYSGITKLPFLKGLKVPKTIYITESKYNGKIEVIEIGKTRKIKVGGIDQSLNWDAPNASTLVWGKLVEVIKANIPDLKNIMVLGLGGGTVQQLLSRKFPGTYITSVEIDNTMVDIAKKYFDLDSIPNHKVIVEDACRVVVTPTDFGANKNSFEAVVVDIYIGDKYPELGKSGNFVSALRNLLLPGGLVVFNRIYTKHHQEDVNSFIDFVEGFYHNVQTYTVAGHTNSDNVIIYGRA